jgi:hypothetical protein
MTVLRTVAIIFIFFCSVIAWVILGGTLYRRTEKAKESATGAVRELWGTEQYQRAPRFYYSVARTVGAKKTAEKTVYINPTSSDVKVELHLDYRKKGLLWFSTYVVEYFSNYRVKNDSREPRKIYVEYRFPATHALYDNFTFLVKNKQVRFPSPGADRIITSAELAPGETAEVVIGYKSSGLDRWGYSFGEGVTRVRNFKLVARTDFKDIDFPEGCVSPTAKEETDEGWVLTWQNKDLVTGYQLGVEMPKKLNPGPIASRMSFFAPVSLLFFFTVLFIISAVKVGQVPPLHPMNYFFLAAAFFAFHVLFAYLADHVEIHFTFVISTLVSCLLVFVYVALARGARYALFYATLPQFTTLILFSYAFFYRGYTGLIITIGSVATLTFLMVATARVDWAAKFRPKQA